MMHELRATIAAGEALKPSGPIAKKAKPAAPKGGLTAIAVKREESRLTDQRREPRHRELLENATIYFRRRPFDVPVINVSPNGVMIEADIDPWIGDELAIQFSDCNRTKCVVRWIRDRRIGLEFREETTIIGPSSVRDLIIRRLRGEAQEAQDEGAGAAKATRAPRQTLIWMATLHFEHDTFPARLRNISTDGAMIESKRDFPVGSEVLLDLGDAGTVFGIVRWSKGGQLGLRFSRKFDLKNLARSTATEKKSGGTPAMNSIYMLTPRGPERQPAGPPTEIEGKMSIEELRASLMKKS
jgi:hypothetical protein